MHEVALGYIIKEHASCHDLFPIIVKRVMCDDGTEYKGDDPELIHRLSDENIGICMSHVNLDEYREALIQKGYNIIYHEDITNDRCYTEDERIHVGDPTGCAMMIWVACADEDCDIDSVSDSTLAKLQSWKRKLVEDGRMHDTPLCLKASCC